jgi:hypothetical protein
MEITKISFSDQHHVCRKNGNIIEEKCAWCNHTNIMCKKYGGTCQSIKCVEERKKLMDNS